MKHRSIALPTIRPVSVEGCGTSLAYLVWMAWPGEDQACDRDACFKGGMASIAKAAQVRRPEFPGSLKGHKPDRAIAKVNNAFRIVQRDRWRAVSMAVWQVSERITQVAAAQRLADWSRNQAGLADGTKNKEVKDGKDTLPHIRARIWRDSLPVIPMAFGFFHSTGYMQGAPLSRKEIISAPEWVPVAINLCQRMADELTEKYPNAEFIVPRLR